MRALVLAALTLAATSAQAQWRLTSLDLDVSVLPETRTLLVSGTARAELSRASSESLVLVLGAGGVVFDSAHTNPSAPVTLSAHRDSLIVAGVARPVAITFFAHADHDLGRNRIRPEGAIISWGAQWYPVIAVPADSAAEMEITGTTRITVPARWRTLAPGRLTDSSIVNDLRTERWETRRPTARSLIAAEFIPRTARIDSVPVSAYLLRRHAARATDFSETLPKMVKVLSAFFGPYPFDSFGIAELPREVAPPGFGGRSEPGYFIAHTDALEGAGINVPLFAHELTHMWFPNAVDSRPPGDDMMDEAIASYGVAVYREVTEGRAAARRELIAGNPDFSMRAYFHEMRIGTDEKLMADYSPVIARAKGPMVYDMLRTRIGDSAFFGVWRGLAKRGGSASLADLRTLYLARVPRDTGLAHFFSQWMDRAGAPIVEWQQTARNERLTLMATQHASPYELDVPLRLHGRGGTRDTVVHISHQRDTLRLPNASSAEVDPDDRVLLWKPRFGPAPDSKAPWPKDRWEPWMQDEMRWLMNRYEVGALRIVLTAGDRVVWTSSYGAAAPTTDDAVRRATGQRVDNKPFQEWKTTGDDVTLIVGRPSENTALVAVARGGWGGRQLTMHAAQRVALQFGWQLLPKY